MEGDQQGFKPFLLASGLQVNPQKTTLYQYGVCQLVLDSLNLILPYNFKILQMVLDTLVSSLRLTDTEVKIGSGL
jgi:hypothetical protein